MKILVINTGSSSIKYQLFNIKGKKTVLASGVLEKIGEPESVLNHENHVGETKMTTVNERIPDHSKGMEKIVSLLTDKADGVLRDKSEVDAVGHRVVHGGETFQAPSLIDDSVLEAIKENIPLAPLHNPANVTGIEVSREIFPDAQQVAVFDTAFHHTIPPKAHLYALPYDLYSRLKIRRYGFHGTSHHYVAETVAESMGQALEDLNLITIHLGNGGSITAIEKGRSIDTSMGMTPLEGLIMGTRSGDIDPAIHFYLARHTDMTVDDMDTLLNKKSGLKGICGKNDMREILDACNSGDEQAKTAVSMYVYRIRKYIGAYFAVLGRVDALVFTAGIGEHSFRIRHYVCQGLETMGIVLDEEKNRSCKKGNQEIHADSSKTKIYVIPTNEELKIALETKQLLQAKA